MPDLQVLLPYQKTWLEDSSAVKVWEKSRRIGASYGEALDDVIEASKSKEAGGQDTFYLSYNKDMTRQFVSDAAEWAKVMNIVISGVEEVVLKDEDQDITVYRVTCASGFSVWGMPSVARSIRSKQGIVVIDEAAFVDDLDELLKSAMAMLMWGGKVRIISTHNGDDNRFNQLVQEIRAGRVPYSLHTTTLDKAISDGLYQRICLVKGVPWTKDSDQAWRQELVDFYKEGADEELFCVPARSGTAYFPRALLESCADRDVLVVRKACKDDFTFQPEDVRESDFQNWFDEEVRPALAELQHPAFVGEDFARSGDLTCIEIDEREGDGSLPSRVVVELRNVPFAQQWQTLQMIVSALPSFGGMAVDARGNGQMIGEYAAQKWPSLVHQVMITAAWYAANFPRLKGRMEDRTTTIPGDRETLDDFRVVGLKAGVPQVLERTGDSKAKRHGDAAIAKLMALFAALEDPGTIQVVATARSQVQKSPLRTMLDRFRRPRS